MEYGPDGWMDGTSLFKYSSTGQRCHLPSPHPLQYNIAIQVTIQHQIHQQKFVFSQIIYNGINILIRSFGSRSLYGLAVSHTSFVLPLLL